MSEAVELARALTGEELPVSSPELPGLVAELVQLGWDASRLVSLRRGRQAERRPWPFPVDAAAVRQVGFARFEARLAELRGMLGLSGELSRSHVVDRPFNDDERRLAAERPPHWG
ncbi:hypothetical protein [Arachnia propionica]|uniref:Uncharacterized protein n=1 Tax=Arachnia propionica TaxID=1750 RepID=A0A3P1WX39_9ACTN|nr:hypothetical protein [Arachnia propionica]RRD50811.1 hypothetical protein EII35_03525 [Arachnia propionica]